MLWQRSKKSRVKSTVSMRVDILEVEQKPKSKRTFLFPQRIIPSRTLLRHSSMHVYNFGGNGGRSPIMIKKIGVDWGVLKSGSQSIQASKCVHSNNDAWLV